MTGASAYQPLHHKYRPQRFDQLVGQEAISTTLGNALIQNRIAPAYLFSGPRGTGKTSSARILARSLNCLATSAPTTEPCGLCELCRAITAGQALDVIEIDAASNTGVDNIRDLIERSRFAPVQARWKVYVIDECHMLSTAAFNALLKTLEEPPPRVVFVLATTDPQRVLPTILSRCQRFDFRRIPLEALEQHLRFIAAEETIGVTAEALHVVALRAQGGLRDAESLLDQLSLLPPPVEASAVWELLGAVPEADLLELVGAMATGDPLGILEACRRLLDRGREPGAVLQGLASLLRDLVLAGVAPDRLDLSQVSATFQPQLPDLARRIGGARLLHWQAQLKGSEQQLRQSVQPRLWLEVLLLGLLADSTPGAEPVGQPGTPRAQTLPPTPAAPPPPAPGARSSQPSPAPELAVPAVGARHGDPPGPGAAPDLAELWQQILAALELPSTRMLLSQQASLVRLDDRRAVIRVSANWIAMVQSRLPLLEAAVGRALGSPRQLVLDGGAGAGEPQGSGPQNAVARAGTPAAGPAPPSTPLTPPPTTTTPPQPVPRPPSPPAAPSPSTRQQPLDEQAQRLAEFFNGEVIRLDGTDGDPGAAG